MSTIRKLWEREMKISEIERLKQRNEHDIVKVANEVKEKKKTNKYLVDMVDELTDYKNAIVEIKLSQERRLYELIKYLEINLNDAGLNELQVRKLNKERVNIETKLKEIRQELKELEI
mgnify:FL=1|tara:strand:- start:507 stop:860 length:354 start_codon:yes stop_codon:yes gene_type:complete